jgi:hypothetical protein
VRVGFGEHGFQLIARRLAGNLQLPGGDIGRHAARDDAGEFGFRMGELKCFGEDRRGRPGPGTQGIQRQERTHFLRRLMLRPLKGQMRTITGNLSMRGIITGSAVKESSRGRSFN